MPFCENCGKTINQGGKFCKHCGASVIVGNEPSHAVTPPQQPEAYTQPQYGDFIGQHQDMQPVAPRQPLKRSNGVLIGIAIVISVIAVVAICVAAFNSGLLGGKSTGKDNAAETGQGSQNNSAGTDHDSSRAEAPNTAPALTSMITKCPAGFSYIPPGTFTMGATGDEIAQNSDDIPKHPQTMPKGLCLAKYETTLGEWQNVMGYTPINNTGNPSVRNFESCGKMCPVVWVSWNDVQAYLQKYNDAHGGGYRLPTETEWEYAAREGGKAVGAYPNGNYVVNKCERNPQLDEIAWYCGNSDNVGSDIAGYIGWTSRNGSEAVPKAGYFFKSGGPHPVGKRKPNKFDLYDIIGNAREWMQDNYCTRGGSWFSPGSRNLIADRLTYGPNDKTYNIGFRLAYDKN